MQSRSDPIHARGVASRLVKLPKRKKSTDFPRYQTRQDCAGFIGVPFLHPKAAANSGIFLTTPFARIGSGEWGSVWTPIRTISGRSVEQ
jgi:hypothetical protein